MVQTYNYETKQLKVYDNIDTLSKDVGTPKRNIYNHIHRGALLNKRILIAYGNITEEMIAAQPVKKYILHDIINEIKIEFYLLKDISNYLFENHDFYLDSNRLVDIIRLKKRIKNKYTLTKIKN